MPNDVTQMQKHGNLLLVSRYDGTVDTFLPAVEGFWIPPVAPTADIVYVRDNGDQLWSCRTDGPTLFVRLNGEFYTPHDPATGALPPPPPPTGTRTTQQALVDWMVAHIGVYAYSQSNPGRLTPDVSGYTDCSGCVWYCYKQVTGSTTALPGTWTGSQYLEGATVIPVTTANSLDESVMQLGDLVFYDWGTNGVTLTYDHVEMYMGSGQTIGHGGGMGPKIKSLQDNVSYAIRTQVNRYI